MRLCWLLLAALLLSSLPAAGQGNAPTPVASDPADDVAAAAGAPAKGLESTDLLALHARGEPGTLHLAIAVSALEARPIADSVTYLTDFVLGEQAYTVRLQRLVPVDGGPVVRGELLQVDAATGLANLVLDLEPTVAGAELQVAVPLAALRSATGVPAGDGDVLADLVVRAVHSEQEILAEVVGSLAREAGAPAAMPAALHDRMPDTGAVSYTLALPMGAGDAVYVTAPDPVRASNGGPGTFVFPLRLVNQVAEPQDRVLRLDGLPGGWSHAFVADTVRLEACEEVLTQLVVQAAGGHEHGGWSNFTVRVALPDGTPAGEVPLSILYTEVPQPAGHHPRLTFHVVRQGPDGGDTPFALAFDGLATAFGTGFGLYDNGVIMTTLDEHPAAIAQPASPVADLWNITLSPGLGLGLDFDVARTGLVHVTLDAATEQQPAADVVLDGRLLLRTEAGDVELAALEPSEPRDVAGPTDFELRLVPGPAADLVPYAPGQGLVLQLRESHQDSDAERIIGSGPNLLAGWMTLPLLEYQDAVPAMAEEALAAAASPEAPPAKQAPAPGLGVAMALALALVASRRR